MASMALGEGIPILLPDLCLPFSEDSTRSKANGKAPMAAAGDAMPREDCGPLQVTKSGSRGSLSSGSSTLSRASEQSTGSSRWSFAPVKNQEGNEVGARRTRVGIGTCSNRGV